MNREGETYATGDDLWTVTVSFVLYLTLLLVIYNVRAEGGETPLAAGGWRLQDLAALVVGLWGSSNVLAYFARRARRILWLGIGTAQVLGAAGLYRLREEDWVWLAFTALALAFWLYAFQVCLTAAFGGERPAKLPESEPDPEGASFCGVVPPAEQDEPSEEDT